MNTRLQKLKARRIKILARGKYRDAMGALKKVEREIKTLEGTK